MKYNTYRQNYEFLVCPWKESWARPKYNEHARDCSHGQCLLCVFCAHGNSHAHAHAYSHGHARDYVHGHVHYWQTCPLEAPRLLIGLEISPKCYQILYIGQTCPFTHFNTIYGWFPPNYGPKYGPFKQNKFHCFRILYSTIFNNFHEKWTKLHLYKFSFPT